MTRARLLLAVIVVSLLSGCKSNIPGDVNLGPADLVIWQDLSKSVNELIGEAFSDFSKTHSGVRVKVVYRASLSNPQKSKNVVETGNGPDIIVTRARTVSALNAQGLLADVGYLKARRPNVFLEAGWSLGQHGKSYYALPIGLTTWAIAYNKDYVPIPPKSSAALLAKIQDLSSLNRIGLAGPLDNPASTLALYLSLSPKGNRLIDPYPTALYYQLVMDLIALQASVTPGPVMNEEQSVSKFMSEEAGMLLITQATLPKLEKTGLRYGITPLPRVSGTSGKQVRPINGAVACVSAYSENKELAAFACLDAARSPRVVELLDWLGDIPAAKKLYSQSPYNSDDITAFKSFLAAGSFALMDDTQPLYTSLKYGLNLALTLQNSPTQAALSARDKLSLPSTPAQNP